MFADHRPWDHPPLLSGALGKTCSLLGLVSLASCPILSFLPCLVCFVYVSQKAAPWAGTLPPGTHQESLRRKLCPGAIE